MIDLIMIVVLIVIAFIVYIFLDYEPRSETPINKAPMPPPRKKVIINTKTKDEDININNMIIGNEVKHGERFNEM